ncbi:MAG: methyltransferase [Candidatus Cloacimonetes bacterium]|nr:methyltransferase [Candidatus Cloacimonadota bacterium]
MATRVEDDRSLVLAGLHRIVLSGEDREAVLEDILSSTDNQNRATLSFMLYGCLRHWHYIEPRLCEFIKGKPLPLDLNILLVFFLFQAFVMDSVPVYAARAEMIKRIPRKFKGLKGVLDGVFQNFLRKYPVLPEFPILPVWWKKALEKQAGGEFVNHLLSRWNKTPEVYVFSKPSASDEFSFEKLGQMDKADRAQRIEMGDLICDPASYLAAYLLKPAHGEKIMDLCAAPGNKSVALLQICPTIHLTSVEIQESRAKILEKRLKGRASVVMADALEVLSQAQEGSVDAILLDAPCSAWGTALLHPEYLLHKEENQGESRIQKELLRKAYRALRNGGRLIYSVCTFCEAETVELGQNFLNEFGGFLVNRNLTCPAPLQWHPSGPGYLLLPHEEGSTIFWYMSLTKQLTGGVE